MNKLRMAVGSIAITGAMLLGIKQHEGFRQDAYIPVKTAQGADVPTIGYGSTYYRDGTKVQLGDTISRQEAGNLLVGVVNENYAKALRSCIKVPLFPAEFSAYLSLSYNIGTSAFCSSTLVKELNARNYAAACRQILRWDKFKGRPLTGLTKRRQEEYKQCTSK